MLAIWVLAGFCLVAAFGLRLNLCWQRVQLPVPEDAPPSQRLTMLDPVPAPVAEALQPFNLASEGFTRLGVFGLTSPGVRQQGAQVWLDSSGTIVGAVSYDVRGSAVSCWFSFASYLGAAGDRAGIAVSSWAQPVFPRYSRPGRQVYNFPGRSQHELLQLHLRQRMAQPDQTFVRLESTADFIRVQDEVFHVSHTWLTDNGIVTRRADGQLWLSRRVLLGAAVMRMPPVGLRRWVVRRRVDRQIRAWPLLAA